MYYSSLSLKVICFVLLSQVWEPSRNFDDISKLVCYPNFRESSRFLKLQIYAEQLPWVKYSLISQLRLIVIISLKPISIIPFQPVVDRIIRTKEQAKTFLNGLMIKLFHKVHRVPDEQGCTLLIDMSLTN